MTIKRKRTSSSGLVEVECDSTDTVDTNGYSDEISTVGAKSAKFSDDDIMKANSGLKLGILQVKINAGSIEPPDFTGSQTGNIDATGTFFVTDYLQEYTGIPFVIFTASAAGTNACGGGLTMTISNDGINYRESNGGVQTFRYIKFTGTGRVDPGRCLGTATVTSSGINFSNNNEVTIRIRSSVSQDSVDGSVIVSDFTINESGSKTFDNLLLVGEGNYFTLEIVSIDNIFTVSLSDITSIKEEST